MSSSQILIAEDENIVALDIQEALKGAQYDVLGIVSSGREAVRTASEKKPDLVLMDIRLKGDMDGVQAATQIRENYDIPVIYLTAYSDEHTIQRAKVTEPFGYLLKPFEKEALHTTIEMALHKHKMERELKENRRWLSTILRGIGDAVAATDAHGRVTFLNPVAEALTGWLSAEARGKMWTEVFNFGEDQAAVEQAFLGGRALDLSPRAGLTSRDGVQRPVHGGISPTLDEKDRLTGFVLAFRDITPRRRLEEQLESANRDLERRVQERTESLSRMNEELQRRIREVTELYDNAPCGYHSLDVDGRVTRMNQTELRWLGQKYQDVVGKMTFSELLTPDSRGRFVENLIVFQQRGWLRDVEYEMVRKDGTVMSVLLSASSEKGADGRFFMARASVYDMTERKRAERALQASESKFRSIAESTPDGVLVADHDGNIIYVNRSVQTLFGHPEKALLGKKVMMLLPPHCQGPLKEAINRLTGGEGFRQMSEIYGIDRAGREFPVEMSLSTWTSGGRRFFAAILRDVTERRQAEAGLQFQASILSQVKDAVVVTDPQNCVVYWNRGAERLYGHKTVDAIGNEPESLLDGHSWVPEEARPAVDAVLAKGEVWHGEAAHRTKDGRDLWVEMSVGVMKDEEGAPIGRLMTLRDVTERKRLHNMLLHTERLAAMGQMAAGIAHELKTPLGVIYGFADVLAQRKPGAKGGGMKTEELMQTIQRQVVRCTHLVDNLLSFSRKHAPAEGLQPVELNTMIASALTLVGPHAVAKSVSVRRELAETPLWVSGSQDMLEQVMVNLAVNAADAMDNGGKLTFRTSSREKDGALWAEIQVEDTGPGIAPELRRRIFEPFFTTKGPGRGTGLGLWLSREIVTGFGGVIECDNAPGKGTVFSVLLPIVKAPEKQAEAAPSEGTFSQEEAHENP
jgi:PAS domain S-box-containing protein